jgi:acyl carrier protein
MDDAVSETVTSKVIASIAKTKQIEPETISLDATLEDLKFDSLDGLNLFFELEEAFDLNIPDGRARSLRSVRQIVEGLQQMLQEQDSSNPGSSTPT